MTDIIPGPSGLPILGNFYSIDQEVPIRSLERLADTYGEIFQLTLAGKRFIFVSSYELVNEVCNEKRFSKTIAGALKQVRNGVKDGLFTAYTGEPEWDVAHRVLMPAFGPLSIRGMYDEMYDISSQLVLKWARQTPTTPIHVTDDFTRLALDTLALCAMGARFNSYYTEGMHPFVDAMGRFLTESGNRGRRPELVNSWMTGTANAYFADIDLMKRVSKELVAERRKNPTDKKDLLNAMMNGRDPKTGKGMSDESIINNMITFLIAGHETTSGTLSFVFFNLIKNPRAYKLVQEEVDRVVGRDKVSAEHLSNLPYISAVIRETLRLSSPITAIGLEAHPFENHEDPILLGGKYEIKKEDSIIALIIKMHKDPTIYGADAGEFKPERMLQEEFDALPKNAWKPFGNGVRGCIGRPFAWQEMLIVLCLLFQNFNFQADDTSYQMQLKQTLTIKPKDFLMRATLREGIDPITLDQRLQAPKSAEHDAVSKIGRDATPGKQATKPMSIYYGSNTGTCEAFAGRLASDARRHGYNAKVDTLDSAIEKVPKGHPVIIITASYEGQPPDNAAHFFEWLNGCKGDALKGTKFAVFGCGHHDWQATFHRIPKEIQRLFLELGAEEICDFGRADAAGGDMFTDFDNWEESKFWPALGGGQDDVTDNGSTLEVSVNVETRSSQLGQQLLGGLVVDSRVLTASGEPEKRHIEIRLPTDMSYKVGDYLAVLPTNPAQDVKRVMRRFGLPWDAVLRIASNGHPTSLPTDMPISANDLLSSYVELSQPATRRDVLAIAGAAGTSDEKTKIALEELANDPTRFAAEISHPRVSPIDLLEKYPDVAFPIGDFLALLPLMRIRQYSISASPLGDPTTCTLSFGVLNTDSTASNRKHLGVASNFLSGLEKGDHVQVSVRKSHGGFQLPLEISTVPIIMIAAGTGFAPFRGFIQERAAQIAAGRKVAPGMLFIGCRAPGADDIYAEELARWETMGAVQVKRAFSRDPNSSEGCKYVQDRLWHDRKEARELFDKGAKVFVCGSREIGVAVREVCMKICGEAAEAAGKPKTEEEKLKWFEGLGKERFATDVFA